MQTATLKYSRNSGWTPTGPALPGARLVLYFGLRQDLEDGQASESLTRHFPHAKIVGCSTDGNILGGDLIDNVVAVAISFSQTTIAVASVKIDDAAASFSSGQRLAQHLRAPDLAGIMVLSDGLHVNGTGLIAGLAEAVGSGIPISGGLAGDGADFIEALVGVNGRLQSKTIAAIGFYGRAIRFGAGSGGGWDVFGPKRTITRATDNVLWEIDGAPALGLYELYLGQKASALLPGSALLFQCGSMTPTGRDTVLFAPFWP